MNFKNLLVLIEYFENSKLNQIELESKKIKLKINKSDQLCVQKSNKVDYQRSKLLIDNEECSKKLYKVRSPLVGNFYYSSPPLDVPLINIGHRVNKGDVLCIIEAFKIMNEITSPVDGVVSNILLRDGEVASFDQTLVELVIK